MATIFSAMPVEALGERLVGNETQFWCELRRLDRLTHLVRTAALNHVVSDLLLEPKAVQLTAMRLMVHDHWIDRESHARIGAYLRGQSYSQKLWTD